MEVQVLEFSYDAVKVPEIESQINAFLEHHDVVKVEVTQWRDQLLVFAFYEE